MATQQDLDAVITSLTSLIDSHKTAVQEELTKIDTEISSVNDAFSRLLQKIAAGNPPTTTVDFQSEVDIINSGITKLKAMGDSIAQASTKLDSAIAQAQVEGN